MLTILCRLKCRKGTLLSLKNKDILLLYFYILISAVIASFLCCVRLLMREPIQHDFVKFAKKFFPKGNFRSRIFRSNPVHPNSLSVGKCRKRDVTCSKVSWVLLNVFIVVVIECGYIFTSSCVVAAAATILDDQLVNKYVFKSSIISTFHACVFSQEDKHLKTDSVVKLVNTLTAVKKQIAEKVCKKILDVILYKMTFLLLPSMLTLFRQWTFQQRFSWNVYLYVSRGGVLTPASAFRGSKFVSRLQDRNVKIEVL